MDLKNLRSSQGNKEEEERKYLNFDSSLFSKQTLTLENEILLISFLT